MTSDICSHNALLPVQTVLYFALFKIPPLGTATKAGPYSSHFSCEKMGANHTAGAFKAFVAQDECDSTSKTNAYDTQSSTHNTSPSEASHTSESDATKDQIAHAKEALKYGWICTPNCTTDHEPGIPCLHHTRDDDTLVPALEEWREQCKEPIFYRTRRNIPLTSALIKAISDAEIITSASIHEWVIWEHQTFPKCTHFWNRYRRLLQEDPDHSATTARFRHEHEERGDLAAQGQVNREKREAFLAKTKLPYSMRLRFAREDLDRWAKTHRAHDAQRLCCEEKHRRVLGKVDWADEDEDSGEDDWD